MQLVKHLTYVHERCRSTTMNPTQYVRVKGENYILAALKQEYPLVELIASQLPSMVPTREGMNEWIIYLDKKYPEQFVLFGPPPNLDVVDARRLGKDVADWLDLLFRAYNDSGTMILKADSVDALFPHDLTSVLDETARQDLADGANAILHLIPTPGAMILFRVAEHQVRFLYKKILGKDASRGSWGELLAELEKTGKIGRPLLGYLDYLRDKRNEAEHPDKRFSQEESERILLQVKGLLEEIRSLNAKAN